MASETSEAPTSKTEELLETATVGMEFQMIAPATHDLADIRRAVRLKTGLDMHVKFLMGPTRISADRKIGCPIEAVDDPYLSFQMRLSIPAEGHILYVGHFKEAKKQ